MVNHSHRRNVKEHVIGGAKLGKKMHKILAHLNPSWGFPNVTPLFFDCHTTRPVHF